MCDRENQDAEMGVDMREIRPKIAVIGDKMVDIDIHCTCERMSPEGPWPVLKVLHHEHRPGGAGNVAEMVKALGCDVLLLGDDVPHEKTRYYVDGKLTGPRIDRDWNRKADNCDVRKWEQSLKQFRPDAVIVADHGKGVVTDQVMRMIQDYPLFIDPIETTPIYGSSVNALVGSKKELPKTIDGYLNSRDFNGIVVTKLGASGMKWKQSAVRTEKHVPSTVTNAVDPLGAGDQLIAGLTWARLMGNNWDISTELANVAAGMQCLRRGCVPVTFDELAKEMSLSINQNIKHSDELHASAAAC